MTSLACIQTEFKTIANIYCHTFVNSNSASSPVLSINNEATIPFRIINGNASLWNDGETCEFIYDGSYWNLINYDKVEVIRL